MIKISRREIISLGKFVSSRIIKMRNPVVTLVCLFCRARIEGMPVSQVTYFGAEVHSVLQQLEKSCIVEEFLFKVVQNQSAGTQDARYVRNLGQTCRQSSLLRKRSKHFERLLIHGFTQKIVKSGTMESPWLHRPETGMAIKRSEASADGNSRIALAALIPSISGIARSSITASNGPAGSVRILTKAS